MKETEKKIILSGHMHAQPKHDQPSKPPKFEQLEFKPTQNLESVSFDVETFGTQLFSPTIASVYGILGDIHIPGVTIKTDNKPKPLPKQAISFTPRDKETKESKLIDPVMPDVNYPVRAFFNAEKKTTLLMFRDDTKVFVRASEEDAKGKNAANGLIIALARRILGTRTTLNHLYDKFKTDAKTESMFYGVVMGYFVSKGIVRDAEMFDRWLVEYVATRLMTQKSKK